MSLQTELKPMQELPMAQSSEPCCGPPLEPPSKQYEKAGYAVSPYTKSFIKKANRYIPQIKTNLCLGDRLGSIRVRLGVNRSAYKIPPGIYCTGTPDHDSPVLVSANYKLSFDTLRSELKEVACWILVLDTRGVNVWCAAGKKTFSTDELIRQVKECNIEQLVLHRDLIVPQLGAPGISAHQVKKECGFKITWGPIRARDIQHFLANDRKPWAAMREMTFTVMERLVLIPLEIVLTIRPVLIILALLLLVSGINNDIFSFDQALIRWPFIAGGLGLGLFGGTVLVPLFLPWIPGRSFYLKGLITGLSCVLPLTLLKLNSLQPFEHLAIIMTALGISSYAAMNFTGATPFTSPSGVEKEMRRGIPLQIICCLIALAAWVTTPFLGI